MKRFWLILLLYTIASFKLLAQPHNIKRLGIEQGLSNNYVVSITQDKEGFLWFATEEGLNKFDGTRFINYYKNPQGITGNELNRVYADRNHPIIWIATQRAGLNAYDYNKQAFISYQHNPKDPHSLITNDVTDLASPSGKNDGLWISTYYRGIDYLNISTGKFTHYNKATVPALPSEQTWTVMDGGADRIFIGHVENGLSILSLKDKTVQNYTHDPKDPYSIPSNEVHCILKDSNENIWVGTNRGISLFNEKTGTFTSFKNNKSDIRGVLSSAIFSIKQFSDNKLWITTEFHGIAILDLKQNQFLAPEEIQFEFIKAGDDNFSLSNASIRCAYQDSYDNIWIGTWGGGINFISNKAPLFSTWSYFPVPTENSLNNKVASSICIDRENNLWVGTDGGGINVFKSGKRTAIYKKENSPLSDNSILASLRDSEGNLWFGTFQGSISYYDTRTKTIKKIEPNNNSHLDIRTFYEDRDKNIWIGSSEGIYVFSLRQKKIINHFTANNSGLPENFIRAIVQDSFGRFWIGTFGGGIAVFNANFKLLKLLTQNKGLCSNTINHLICDSRKQIWAATGEGLVCFYDEKEFKYKTFQRKSGLNNTHIRAICEDQKGNIWVSTNRGISCLPLNKQKFYNYDHSDGVPLGNFMSGSVAKDNKGGIYFGSINGLCHFDPHIIMNRPQSPVGIITEIKIFGRLTNQENKETILPLSAGQNVQLNYKQNSFRITFNVQNYSLVSQTEYAYMLQGLEDSWYNINKNNSVIFRNIPPGKYKFLIKTRIHNQNWSQKITTLEILISPPLWLTWWAKSIYILLAIVILWSILYAYKKKIKIESLYNLEKKNREQEQELNNERLRFYTNITHELRTPLTLVLGPLEDIQKDTSLSIRQVHKISVVHQSAIRLLNLVNQLLEFRKTETQNKQLCISKGNIAALIYEIGSKYKELSIKPGVIFSINVASHSMPLFFDKEVITIIIDNLISNAIKYTEKGKIELSVYQITQKETVYTEIKVSDTGHGISAKALPHIFDRYYQENSVHQASGTGIGLALVKNLVRLHQGEIRVESVLEKGSSFYLRLLTDNTYPNALHIENQEETNTSVEKEKEDSQRKFNSDKPILLVVEDNQEIRDYISESLSSHFEIIEAANGKEGEALAIEHVPDIIISDIMMPIMDGISLCKLLKEDIRTSHIPIVLLTAKDSLQDKEEGYTVGADSYLTKPFNAALLLSRINNLIESRKKLVEQFAPNNQLKDKQATRVSSLNKLDNEFINKITVFIEEKLSSDKTDITYLSEKMCMSSSTLYRKMKALTGLSTNEYIRKIRMENAERLLLEGRYSISEISYKVGINSTVYFRQCFKDEFGVSPSEYLKRMSS